MRPARARGRPQMVISRVVLPAPLEPISVAILPGATLRLMPCSTSISPYPEIRF
jgi:hypothetical protein